MAHALESLYFWLMMSSEDELPFFAFKTMYLSFFSSVLILK